MNRRTTVAALLLALAVALAGCGTGTGTEPTGAPGPDATGTAGEPEASKTLTVYSGRKENLIGPIIDRFQEASGITVEVKYADSAELALLVETEGDRSPADVFVSQSPGATGYLAARGLLGTIDADVLELVQPRFRNAAGHWVGVTGRQRVLVYNEQTVDAADLPATIAELMTPAYAGTVAIAPSNGSFQDFITAMREVEGEEQTLAFLRWLAETDAPTYSGNGAIVEAVGRGEVAMGLVNHYYNHQFLAEDPSLPTRNHYFDGDDIGALLMPATASVLASADATTEARAFIEFLLAQEAQRYFADETYEYPLVTGVAQADGVPELATLELFSFQFDDLGEGLARTLELIREAGLEGA